MSRLAFATILCSLLLWGCGDGNNENPGPDPGPLNLTYKVSECGGFAKADKADAPLGYCDAEVLDWSYDAAKGKLSLSDKRALLNCCGDHSVAVTEENGTYVITETDAPQASAGGARCHCMCVFDFEASFDLAGGGLVSIKLVRDVTDDNEPAKTIFSGQLDLSKGSGSEVLDTTDATGWCEASAPQDPSAQTFAISECGGFEAKSSDTYSGAYCDAEVLKWELDPATGAVTFTDQRALLNCCGERSMKVALENGTYVISQSDAPEQAGRCLCMCVFDLAVTVDKLSGTIPVKLVRDITDDNEPAKTLYSGTIDLSAGSGAIVVDTTDAGGFCSQP